MATTFAAPTHEHRALSVTLWIGQAVLFLAFLMSAIMKLGTPIDALARTMPWVDSVSPGLVRFIGLCELAGATGVVLPALTRIRPRLTIAAAVGLAILTSFAFVFHLLRGEPSALLPPLVLGAIALFVAWGRGSKHVPITPRT